MRVMLAGGAENLIGQRQFGAPISVLRDDRCNLPGPLRNVDLQAGEALDLPTRNALSNRPSTIRCAIIPTGASLVLNASVNIDRDRYDRRRRRSLNCKALVSERLNAIIGG